MLASQKQQIIALFQAALTPIVAGSALQPTVILERPRDPSHGDIACNIAMQLAKPLKKNPRELAQALVAAVLADPARAGLIETVEIAGPGFINLRLTAAAKQAVVKAVLAEGGQYGKSKLGAGKKVLVEFVSANPTGPLHVGHGRQAALGDALSALLEAQGYRVTREFYYNDAGVQIATLANSTQARASGFKPGDAGLAGVGLQRRLHRRHRRGFPGQENRRARDGEPVTGSGDIDDLDSIRRFAVAYLRHEQDLDLQAFGVSFDNYYLESSLYTDGKVDAAVEAPGQAAGKTYEQDGALWLRTTDYGDDKDRVMRKSDGTYTYFVPDVAYHIAKWQRGFTKVDQYPGHRPPRHDRPRARRPASGRMGIPRGLPGLCVAQDGRVMKGGEEVKISKRAGCYVTLRDLIEWSNGEASAPPTHEPRDLTRGRDAVRFFLISRKADTEFVFDVDIALTQGDENPVYYVQYAHARICSVLANGAATKPAWPGRFVALDRAARRR